MNRVNTISRAFFSLFVLCTQQASPLHIKAIRNELERPITMTYYKNGVISDQIYISELCIRTINFVLPESSLSIEDKLDKVDHYIEICTSPKIKFFCAEGNRDQTIDGHEYHRHASWIQKFSIVKELLGKINILSLSYGLESSLNTSRGSIEKSQAQKSASFTLKIAAEDCIEVY